MSATTRRVAFWIRSKNSSARTFSEFSDGINQWILRSDQSNRFIRSLLRRLIGQQQTLSGYSVRISNIFAGRDPAPHGKHLYWACWNRNVETLYMIPVFCQLYWKYLLITGRIKRVFETFFAQRQYLQLFCKNLDRTDLKKI